MEKKGMSKGAKICLITMATLASLYTGANFHLSKMEKQQEIKLQRLEKEMEKAREELRQLEIQVDAAKEYMIQEIQKYEPVEKIKVLPKPLPTKPTKPSPLTDTPKQR